MLNVLRVIMSLLGAAAAPALAAGLFSYRVMDRVTAVPTLNLAQSTLSIVFANALFWAVVAGIPLFWQLLRRGRLNWRRVATWSTVMGVPVVILYFTALHGGGASPVWIAAWLVLPILVIAAAHRLLQRESAQRYLTPWYVACGLTLVVILAGPETMLFTGIYIAPYVVLAPLGALTALLVWKTFPMPEAEAAHA